MLTLNVAAAPVLKTYELQFPRRLSLARQFLLASFHLAPVDARPRR